MAFEQEIFDKALMFVRMELSESQKSLLREMCLCADDELTNRLKNDVSKELIKDQYIRAAGALAASLLLEGEGDKPEAVSAGHISIRRGKSSKSAADILRRQAELMLTGYIGDDGFAFRTVRS